MTEWRNNILMNAKTSDLKPKVIEATSPEPGVTPVKVDYEDRGVHSNPVSSGYYIQASGVQTWPITMPTGQIAVSGSARSYDTVNTIRCVVNTEDHTVHEIEARDNTNTAWRMLYEAPGNIRFSASPFTTLTVFNDDIANIEEIADTEPVRTLGSLEQVSLTPRRYRFVVTLTNGEVYSSWH